MFREPLGSFVFVGFVLSRGRTTIVTEGGADESQIPVSMHREVMDPGSSPGVTSGDGPQVKPEVRFALLVNVS
jgi:hypothetical protein